MDCGARSGRFRGLRECSRRRGVPRGLPRCLRMPLKLRAFLQRLCGLQESARRGFRAARLPNLAHNACGQLTDLFRPLR